MKLDILIENVQVFNSYYKRFTTENVAVIDGKFLYIGKRGAETFDACKVIDGTGKYMVPGLIDIHLHIESTMVTPETFSFGLIQNGVTTIVPEPHEMANVFGIKGVTEMMKASRDCVVDMFYAIPSSVPATSLETTGGAIEIEDIDKLLQTGEIICLGEIMNYVDVISDPTCKTNQILNHIREQYPQLTIEGHVPKLLDLDLHKMIYKGVDSDHTHQTIEGMEARIAAGMFIEIQEKSMSQEVIDYLIEHDVAEHYCFITDDVMTDSLQRRGHLNHIAKKAIQMGMSAEQAIYACTYTPSRRMKMLDRGVIGPGKVADFLLLSELDTFKIEQVFKNGKEVYDARSAYKQEVTPKQFPASFYESVKLSSLCKEDFMIMTDKADGYYPCRVMVVQDGSTFTKEIIAEMEVNKQKVNWEQSQYGLIATFERYGKNGNRAHGLIGGDIIKNGAIATTYSHDNHNLLVLGQNGRDMEIAANAVIKNQGGICVVSEGKVLQMLKLPVGGILSEEPLELLAQQVEELRRTLADLGYKHYNSIMSISTLSLPVSPALKITDFGLINVNEGEVVPLVVS
ncbi:adenine deaminase C-terminal domain-containing protein [Halalkalibacter krulwichiae]|uniref:Adenine deaminase n=1 Tax=Halalkalibacter krulwichiae TaxID=199441 RepID=A0A1X9MKM8_9BACI|nr:adenine deaminase C-terminal domain-containing protein [Halalkalibacter krulwichiae]ARK32231.1 Adenine deaminase [Halalkalibacter krulwichiae]